MALVNRVLKHKVKHFKGASSTLKVLQALAQVVSNVVNITILYQG